MAVRVLQWSCRSVFGRLPEFEQFLSTFRTLPEIVCLQEAHLASKYQPSLPGCTLLRKDGPPRLGRGGGLCIAVKRSMVCSEVATASRTSMEVMGIKLNDLYLFNMCGPPGSALDPQFFHRLAGFRRFILCGDFNGRHGLWGGPTSSAAGGFLFAFVENHDLIVLNASAPTHFSFARSNMWRVLDLAVTSRSIACRCSTEMTNEFLGGDHSIMSVHMDRVHPALDCFLHRWLLSGANWSGFRLLCDSGFSDGLTGLSVSEMYTTFEDCMREAAVASIPQSKNSHKISVPWWK